MHTGKFFVLGTILALLGAIAGGLLIASPALAVATSTKITINNHSGYADTETYLIVWGKTTAKDVHSHLDLVTGTLIPCKASDNTYEVIRDDGITEYYAQYWITLNQLPKNPDGSYSFTCPVVNSARLFISFRKPVYLHINSGATDKDPVAVAEPDDANIYDPTYKTLWDKFEWTLDGKGLHANTTAIDFFGLPLQFIMKRSVGLDLGPLGFSGSRGAVTRHLNPNALLSPLKTPYRYYSPKAINPTQAPITRPPIKFPDNYFKPYVDWVWAHRWQTADSLQVSAGGYAWTGQISGGVLTLKVVKIPGETHTINKPTQDWDILACAGIFNKDADTFKNGAAQDRDGAIKNEIASAINRGVMHRPTADWSKKGYYYTFEPSGLPADPLTPPLPADNFRFNIYSQYLHQVAINQFIYGYPYDDKYDQASYTTDPNGTELVVTINNCKDMGLTAPINAFLLFD